ncbi:magnesium transporter CorA family protein [soil metagenome]
MATTRLYKSGKLVEKDFPVADISEYIDNDEYTIWADFVSPTSQDLEAIREELGLHRLAVEDAINEHQRPKLDQYDTHKFLVAYSAHYDEQKYDVSKAEVSAFILKNALVTVHGKQFEMDTVVKRWDDVTDLAGNGVSYLLWGLLDVVVDSQLTAVQAIDSDTDELEEALFDENGAGDKEVERRSFQLRKALVVLRRSVVPMRDMISLVLRHESNMDDKAMVPYFQDVYDHVLRTTEWTDTVRDLISTILDTNIGLRGNRMNLIMKKVTSWAAIIAIPTAITGFFGQNLKFPGFGTVWGVVFSTALIVVTAGALYLSFKKRDWL